MKDAPEGAWCDVGRIACPRCKRTHGLPEIDAHPGYLSAGDERVCATCSTTLTLVELGDEEPDGSFRWCWDAKV